MPRPDMLAFGSSAHRNLVPNWFALISISVFGVFYLARSCSFSLNARGVNVMVGNIYEGFLVPRSHCHAAFTNIFYATFI